MAHAKTGRDARYIYASRSLNGSVTLFAITRYLGLLHMRHMLKAEFGKGKTGKSSERQGLLFLSVTDAAISPRPLIGRCVAGIALFVGRVVNLKHLSGHLVATLTVELWLTRRHLFTVQVHMMQEFLDTELAQLLGKIDQRYLRRVDRRLMAQLTELPLLWKFFNRKNIGVALDAGVVSGAPWGCGVVSALMASLTSGGLVPRAVVVEF